jgi:hypothetical protein
MSDTESFGWGCYWRLKSNQKQVSELIEIIEKLGGQKELEEWRNLQIVKEQKRQERKLKRELNKLKKKK